MTSLAPWLALDAVCLISVIVLLRRYLTIYHPVTIYIFFHLYAFTSRAWSIFAGSPPMYSTSLTTWAINDEEITRALLWADVALVSLCMAATFVHKSAHARARHQGYRLNANVVWLVCAVCLPIGLAFFVAQRAALSGPQTEFEQSGYFFVIALWPIACLLVLIFLHGFRPLLVVFVGVILGIYMFQGFHRFMVVLPVLFLASTYVVRTGRRWLPASATTVMVAAAMIFPQLKYIGQAVQRDDMNEAMHSVAVAFFLAPDENSSSEQFLDQFAGALTLADRSDTLLYGRSYFAVLTLPLPRALWPEKPGLGDHVISLATKDRPYDTEGRIITYIGESYLNFGYAGIVAVASLLGWLLTAWYRWANVGAVDTLRRYVYLGFMISLIQLYRDGLASLVLFGFFFNLPMIFIWLGHLAIGRLGHHALASRPPL